MGPSASLMPYFMTMSRARLVARSKSLLAPVVIWFMNTSSAMRPPNSMLIWFSMYSLS